MSANALTVNALAAAVPQALHDAGAALAALGRADLQSAVNALVTYGPSAAQWQLDRNAAQAAGDEAKLDALDRTFEQLEAAAVLELADAGVLTQGAGERVVGSLLSVVGKFVIAAAVA